MHQTPRCTADQATTSAPDKSVTQNSPTYGRAPGRGPRGGKGRRKRGGRRARVGGGIERCRRRNRQRTGQPCKQDRQVLLPVWVIQAEQAHLLRSIGVGGCKDDRQSGPP